MSVPYTNDRLPLGPRVPTSNRRDNSSIFYYSPSPCHRVVVPSSGLSTVRIARVNSISGTKDRSVNVEIVLLDIFMGLFSFSCSFCFSREGGMEREMFRRLFRSDWMFL